MIIKDITDYLQGRLSEKEAMAL